MNSKRFIVGDVLGFGWRVMASNFWFFVGLGLIAGILEISPVLVELLIEALTPAEPAGELLAGLLILVMKEI